MASVRPGDRSIIGCIVSYYFTQGKGPAINYREAEATKREGDK